MLGPSTDIQRYRAFLKGALASAAVYESLAATEPNPNRAQVYRQLASLENAHAQFWRRRLNSPSAPQPARAGALAWLAGCFGLSFGERPRAERPVR
jgi:hypothetical protein